MYGRVRRAVRAESGTEEEYYSHAEEPLTTRYEIREWLQFFERYSGLAITTALALWH
jgi:hypothetical protein